MNAADELRSNQANSNRFAHKGSKFPEFRISINRAVMNPSADVKGRLVGWAWLNGKLVEPPKGLPDFGGWMGKWCGDREDFWAAHPRLD